MPNIQKLKDAVISHWERMIVQGKKFVETGIKEKPGYNLMESAMGEYWYGKYCAFCKEFGGLLEIEKEGEECSNCPVYLKDREQVCDNEDSYWRKVSHSKTWQEWVENAEKFLKFLRTV